MKWTKTALGIHFLSQRWWLVSSQDAFTPRCEDCWCVPGDGESCPDFSPGIYQSFPLTWVTLFKSFQLTSEALNLVGDDGIINSCFPFSGAVDDSLVTYPESQQPPCVVPDEPDTAVCAYVVDEEETECSGRSYSLQTFDSLEAKNSTVGANLVHSGACGVCSNAGDLAARMATISTLQSQSITCGFDYVLDSSFDGLVSCYTDIGFSTPCATLYAHYTATNFNLCGKQGVCFPDQATNELTMNNFSQPGCPFNACYNCSVSFGAVFDKLSGLGRNAYNAGFNDEVALPCSYFTRIHGDDPCKGTSPTISPAPVSTPSPQPPASNAPAPNPTSASQGSWRPAWFMHLLRLTLSMMSILWVGV